MTTLTELYEPIAVHLKRVRAVFDDALGSDVAAVDRLCRHVGRLRGKMLRPVLVLLAGQACGRIRDEHYALAAVVEIVHMASLVHDDVLDEADLRRNAALRQLLGIPSPEQVPKKWNVSRFQKVLGTQPHLRLLQEMFSTLIQRLAAAVGQLGCRTAGDSTGLSARPPRSRAGRQARTQHYRPAGEADICTERPATW